MNMTSVLVLRTCATCANKGRKEAFFWDQALFIHMFHNLIMSRSYICICLFENLAIIDLVSRQRGILNISCLRMKGIILAHHKYFAILFGAGNFPKSFLGNIL